MTTEKALVPVEQRIALVKADIELAERMIESVLEPSLDWGLHPGTSSYALKDPGASKLINAFQCYPRAKVLFREVTQEKIAYVVEVELVSRQLGEVMATGSGACTTMETKYAYRWVDNPEFYGYPREGLKSRKSWVVMLFRIPNPDWQELENTLFKMARKRAEVDAAQGLPGVGTALARIFSRGKPDQTQGQEGNQWTHFWTQVKAMGLTNEEVHSMLGVSSMKEWTQIGGTLASAISQLSKTIASRGAGGKEVIDNASND